ncbi:hypothetical protein BaRGS_00036356 [Batillaria attramentaria]|uniref:Centromere protein K n=1 Tax=Batillaria attramentaria TaxID=370345 RepID=A0ABD0JDA4_9CAEN
MTSSREGDGTDQPGEVTEFTENPDSETAESISTLKAACEKTWADVKQTQEQLRQCQQPQSTAHFSEQQPLLAILREKERRLRAEIQVAKESRAHTLPNDTEVVAAALNGELQKKVSQLRETKSLITAQLQELQASIEKEKQFEQQLKAVHDKLQEKCQALEAQEPAEDALEAVAQELETKINAAQKTEQTVMKKMAAFVGKHFPVPEQAQASRSSKELRPRRHQTSQETLPLKDILLELMTKCVESPNDPYMALDERHWPAYVELLLRCNIVLQHPDDDRRIKLVPFHL